MKTIRIFSIDGDLKLIPKRATDGSAGYDIMSSENFAIFPGDTHLTNTGIIIDMPEGIYAEMFSRSGISTKYGLRLSNGVAVIDNDFKKELKVALHRDAVEQLNLFEDSSEALKQLDIKRYDRIAQIIFKKNNDFEIEIIEEFTMSNKKEHGVGFGSTGR